MTESKNPQNYWYTLKNRIKKEGAEQTLTNCKGLKMVAQDGRMRKTDCANTETMFRLIQSVPSPNAEPFKQWLAKVGGDAFEKRTGNKVVNDKNFKDQIKVAEKQLKAKKKDNSKDSK